MNFTIIGAGNTGLACSAYLMSRGHSVLLYTRQEDKKDRLNSFGIQASGSVEGACEPEVTCHLEYAVKQSQHIIITTQSNAHRETMEDIKPYLTSGHRIIILNGNWGAYEGARIFSENPKILVAETGAQPFIASADESGKVHVGSVKNQVPFASTTPENTEIILEEIEEAFPMFRKAASILETSLGSTNPVIHVPIALLNLCRIELGDDFYFYGEGTSPGAVALIEGIDKERIAVARALNVELPTILESINSFFDIKHDNLFDALTKNETYLRAKGPRSLNHRYITEDLIFGILPIVEIGKLVDVETPISKNVVNIFKPIIEKKIWKDTPEFEKSLLNY